MVSQNRSPSPRGIRIHHLFARELSHRPGGLWVGVLAIALSAAAWIGVRLALAWHDRESEAHIVALDRETAKQMAELRNEARLFSRHLGFDTTVLPAGQDPGEFLMEHRSTAFFTLEQAQALADKKPATINHILPVLRGRAFWPTPRDPAGFDAILVGLVGQIFIAQPEFQTPMQEKIEAGQILLGAELAARMNAEPGGDIVWGDKSFRVVRIQPRRGNADDVMAMIHLSDAQDLLDLPGRVGAIMALSCNCPVNPENPFASIRIELARLLPGAQIIGNTIHAEARSRARQSVAKASREQAASLQRARLELRANLETFGNLLTWFVSLGALVTVAALSALNARERRGEIALLKALGVGRPGLLALLAGRAAAMGFAGAVSGVLAAMAIGQFAYGLDAARIVPVSGLLLVLSTAPWVAVAAALVPVLAVAGRDPARELARE